MRRGGEPGRGTPADPLQLAERMLSAEVAPAREQP